MIRFIFAVVAVLVLVAGFDAALAQVPNCANGAANCAVAPGITPVGSASPVISVGTLASEILQYVAAIVIPAVAAFATKVLLSWEQKLGIDRTDAQRDRLQEFIANGLSLGAAKIDQRLSGTMPFEVKNRLVAEAVRYAQEHGADTIKALGGDINDPKTKEALTARATALLDGAAEKLMPKNDVPPPAPAAGT